MAIDTAVKRQSAFIDAWGVVLPDGLIDSGDRNTLVGQYRFLGFPAGGPGDYRLYAELLQDAAQAGLLEDAVRAEALRDAVQGEME